MRKLQQTYAPCLFPASALCACGEDVSGPCILPYTETNAQMKEALTDIKADKFVRDFMQESAVGQPFFKATHRINNEQQIEKLGVKQRAMMPWISRDKMVDCAELSKENGQIAHPTRRG